MNNPVPMRPIVISGPTTVGKTPVAFGLARIIGAEIINADKFYLYDAMPAVTGQSDAHLYPDVRSHLYGVLNFGDQRWTESRYGHAVEECVREIRQRHHPVIVEGCSNGFIRAAVNSLAAVRGVDEPKPLLVGLRWKTGTNLSADCARRATSMMSSGMVVEYRRALQHGCGESYPVRRCFAREPLMAHLSGQISWSVCRNCVAEELEHHARRHYSQLSRIPRVTWLEHDRKRPEETIRRILALAGHGDRVQRN